MSSSNDWTDRARATHRNDQACASIIEQCNRLVAMFADGDPRCRCEECKAQFAAEHQRLVQQRIAQGPERCDRMARGLARYGLDYDNCGACPCHPCPFHGRQED